MYNIKKLIVLNVLNVLNFPTIYGKLFQPIIIFANKARLTNNVGNFNCSTRVDSWRKERSSLFGLFVSNKKHYDINNLSMF